MSEKNIIFGIRPVTEAINSGKQIDKILLKKGAEGTSLNQVRDLARSQKIQIQDVPVEKLNWLTRNATHQGVVAVGSAIEYREITEIVDEIFKNDENPLIVVFDGVTDVRNFGGIARSAECAGVHALVVPVKNSAPVNSDAIKTSAGALNLIPVCRVGSLRNTLKYLQQCGMQIVAATEKSEVRLYDADFDKPTVIVLGNENKGISKEILKMCDVKVGIPLLGSIESLNVSAAAAVMLFEVVRQRI
ncbi:MAG: 23S rRNA (guanosine(2251)-2'-O)-methyltransferase RlmB [Rikenellaceae bacterium]|nr:23S rRNA (guanosine(2251)-2'-O)-methyltransferase RlmB [Rikenellaceae bacterium]